MSVIQMFKAIFGRHAARVDCRAPGPSPKAAKAQAGAASAMVTHGRSRP